jgi:hypothetical protein
LAAYDHDQDSKDTKEEGDTGDEEHEADEKDGEGKVQAGPTLTTAESSGGGDACSFSPPPVDRTHHSVCLSPPRRERKLSGEDQQEDAKRSKSPEKEDVGQADQHGSGGEGGEEMETEHVPLRMYMTLDWTEEEWILCGGSAGGWRESQADSERRRVATHERRW